MIWIAIVIILVALDRFSKYLVIQNIEYGSQKTIIENFFYLTNHDNFGAAWGIFQNGRYFFIAMTSILSVAIIIFMFRQKSIFLKVALSIILSGALGNLIDRIIKGGVTDFLNFYIGFYNFPTFNFADMCLVVGMILLIIYMLFIFKEPDKLSKKDSENKIESSEKSI